MYSVVKEHSSPGPFRRSHLLSAAQLLSAQPYGQALNAQVRYLFDIILKLFSDTWTMVRNCFGTPALCRWRRYRRDSLRAEPANVRSVGRCVELPHPACRTSTLRLRKFNRPLCRKDLCQFRTAGDPGYWLENRTSALLRAPSRGQQVTAGGRTATPSPSRPTRVQTDLPRRICCR